MVKSAHVQKMTAAITGVFESICTHTNLVIFGIYLVDLYIYIDCTYEESIGNK